MLSQIASLFFLQFGVGILLFMLFMPLKQLKHNFYLLNGFFAFSFLLFSLFLFRNYLQNYPNAPNSAVFELYYPTFQTMLIIVMSVFLLSYLFVLFKAFTMTRVLLFVAVLAGIATVFSRGMMGVSGELSIIAQILGGTSLLLGSVLLGWSYGTMILGHWYLVTPNLPFRYLINASKTLVTSSIIRGASLILFFVMFYFFLGPQAHALPLRAVSFNELGLFFIMRVVWGILGPLILSFMILETAKLRSNQAATGILYVACIFVFIGELFADYIFQAIGFPL